MSTITTTDFRLVAFLKSRGVEPIRENVIYANVKKQVMWTIEETENVRALRETFITNGFALYYDYAQKLKGEIYQKINQ